MPIVSIGDMSQHFLSLRNTGNIKSDLARLGQELSTGKVTDISEHLAGDTRHFSGIKHSLDVLSAYKQSADETGFLLDHLQLSLGRVDQVRAQTAEALLTINEHSLPQQIEGAANTARIAFGDIVSAINSRYSGRSVFGGAEVAAMPLAESDTILGSIVASIGAANSATNIVQIIDDWFDDPAGGFATLGYSGDRGPNVTRRVGENQSLEINVRADENAMRDVLKAAALAAVLPDISNNLSQREQGIFLQSAGTKLLSASSETAFLQSKVGYLQETVATSQARLASEKSSLGIAHNNLISADPFETATRLEAVQLQLETHFTVTSRMSRLSLVEYI